MKAMTNDILKLIMKLREEGKPSLWSPPALTVSREKRWHLYDREKEREEGLSPVEEREAEEKSLRERLYMKAMTHSSLCSAEEAYRERP